MVARINATERRIGPYLSKKPGAFTFAEGEYEGCGSRGAASWRAEELSSCRGSECDVRTPSFRESFRASRDFGALAMLLEFNWRRACFGKLALSELARV